MSTARPDRPPIRSATGSATRNVTRQRAPGRAADGRTVPSPADTGLTHRNLPLLLLQAREIVISRFRPILNAHGLTEQQWRIVRALLELGPLEPRQIGEACRISSPSLAGVLARMDDLGLVRREGMPHDARRVLVRPTPRSRALAQAMAPQIEATYAAIEAQIGADVITRCYATLDELIGRLGQAATQDADPGP